MATGLTFILAPKNTNATGEKPTDWDTINPANPVVYTVTWVDGRDGAVLQTDTDVKKDEMPYYKGEMPGAYADENYIYSAPRWEPALAPVTSNVTYTLTFDTRINNLKYEWDMETDGWAVAGFKSYENGLDKTAIISETYVGNIRKGTFNDLVTAPTTTIKANAFKVTDGSERNTKLTSVTIPNSVKIIGESAFKNCNYLTLVHINPKNSELEKIQEGAFAKTSVAEFVMPDSVLSIGESTFAYSSIRSVSLSRKLLGISKSTFDSCKNLSKVEFSSESSLMSIGESAFSFCDSLTSIQIPQSVLLIDKWAFFTCKSLISVTFEVNSMLQSFGNYVFSLCGNLSKITIPDQVRELGKEMFSSCKELKYISFPSNFASKISVIPNGFLSNSGIKSITIPFSVKRIESYAFMRCYKLENIYVNRESRFSEITVEKSIIFEDTVPSPSVSLTVYCDIGLKPPSGDIDVPKGWSKDWKYLEREFLGVHYY